MTTTGQYLVSLSSLPSGSALAHLMAIQVGTGTGEAVYSGTVRVVTSQPGVFVQRKAIRASVEKEQSAPRVSAPKKKSSRTNAAYVFSPQHTAYSFTQTEEVFVLVRNSRETVVQSAINSVVAQRKKTWPE